MPIYDYKCRGCGEEFELLVLKGNVPACPACQNQDLEQLLSSFAVSSAETSRANVKAAQAARKNSQGFKDRNIAHVEEIKEHIREGQGH